MFKNQPIDLVFKKDLFFKKKKKQKCQKTKEETMSTT